MRYAKKFYVPCRPLFYKILIDLTGFLCYFAIMSPSSLKLTLKASLFLSVLAIPFITRGSMAKVSESTKNVFLGPAHDFKEMENSTYSDYIERALAESKKADNDIILIEINTPGGLLTSAIEIKDSILNADRPTICFINKNAISAGSLLFLSVKVCGLPQRLPMAEM